MYETLLIVDDDPVQLRNTEFAVRHKLNYPAITATSPEEAISYALSGKNSKLSLVLLDLASPGKGGLHVIREIKAGKPQLPIIVLTQYGDDEYASRAI